ncbi:MAG: hypothetical protein COV98_01360 [Candidatus Altarchaeum sp. CG12_big_fil_rev_8_21_14_0_65_33_22]|nr:MAG: hypothetical protein COV98_01360 [Candidatus Altarchaeum sp. CG12_big_fil_rev_8_21_14_0_65_33_22]
MKRYPITTDEIVNEFGMRKDVVQKEIKKLEREGVIALEILPDKIFVRLLRQDFMFFNEKKIDRNIIIEQENLNQNKKDENTGYV